MGATIEQTHGYVEARATKLRGAKIYLDLPSVGATENLMMAASLAEGTTVIENAAKEPEIEDLAKALNAMGAQVHGAGTDIIQIEGVTTIARGRPTESFLTASRPEVLSLPRRSPAAMSSSKARAPDHLEAFSIKLKEAGVDSPSRRMAFDVRATARSKASM